MQINPNMEGFKRYAKYLRKSRKDTETSLEETLSKHDLILTNLYKSMNIKEEQVDTFKEVVSGDSISSRPEMKKLLQLVEQGIYSGVLVTEVERLARGNTLDQGIVSNSFQYSNTKIITPSKIYDPCNEYDQEYFEFGLFMSRREYKTINRRLQNGRNASANQGKFVGSKAPYGYKRKKIENAKGWTLEIIEEQANAVKMIYDMYAYKNTSPADICRYLDSINIKPLKSDTWSTSTIRDILSNPTYAGKIKWKNRKVVKVMKDGKIISTQPKNKDNDIILADGIHDSIISSKTFDIVQQKKKENNTAPVPGIYNIQNPLAGLIRCANCKRIMFKVGNILACTNSKCDNVSSELILVEKKLIEGLEIWLKNYEKEINSVNITQNNSFEIIKMKKMQLVELEKQLSDCSLKMNKIYDFLENGAYTIDVFTERRNKLLKEQKEIYSKIEILKNETVELERIENSKLNLIPNLKIVLDKYKQCKDVKEKNDLLKTVIEKAEYLKTKKCYFKDSNKEDFELLIYPKF